MIIDEHCHIFTYPSYKDLSDKIRTIYDVVSLRTKYPALYKARLVEKPIDNTSELISDMRKHGISATLIQATSSDVTNEMVALAARKYPRVLFPLFRIGHDQEAKGYSADPKALRETISRELSNAVDKFGIKGVGEVAVRALTMELHPEKIARDLGPLMDTVAKYRFPVMFPTAWTQFPGALYFGDPTFIDEIAAAYPEVPIILTKMGRGIEYYFGPSLVVALRNANVYFDTVQTTPTHLKKAVEEIGADRIMFGTDWAGTTRWVSEPEDLYSMRLRTVKEAGLSASQNEQILWKTASTLFKIPIYDPV